MATRKKAPPKTFKDAYEILKTNATALQAQTEPDIDNLMTTVEQSIAAYKVCQSRIEAVQQALDNAFADDSLNVDETIDKKAVEK
ncbi:exodeoxyribonuclease VII small subunit [Psychrobacter sp. I-STPA6b]|uniref:exodeoxyribonuclease VII small subunit n=1 Tax=Psychrobacter sp. I-STPA6b TaxID=2585718 RepID=UPI001D0CCE8B|nr:exodeoxyribonuclease VII small subunit [Psychrobacter sp. I-STPA6b]